jgi:hypothetical protein
VEEKLLGHLLKANDPDTDREIEARVANDPAARRDQEILRRALVPLEADREEVEPPADLWVRTLSRVAEHIVATEGPQTSAEPTHTEELLRRAALLANALPIAPRVSPAPSVSEALPITPRRRSVIAMIGLSVALLSFILPGVVYVRRGAQQTACADTMGQFYKAASGYSDTNEGHFPQVEEGKTAATAAETLKEFGYLSSDKRFTCPAAPEQSGPTSLANYAYCLGFRDESGRLRGLDRTPENNVLPIMADAPIREGRQALPGNHYRGQNVLFANGNVRFCTTSLVGVDMDDIFLNKDGKVGAGLYRDDTALGRWNEIP